MEFNEKLRALRKDSGLTQEELAEKLNVSRTAVSKWESGRGFPSIDSLRDISEVFGISIDELVSGKDALSIAESTITASKKSVADTFCGALDSLSVLLLFLPIYAEQQANTVSSVCVMNLTEIGLWQKTVFILLSALLFTIGIATLILSGLKKYGVSENTVKIGFAFSIAATLFYILSRQPYPASLCLFILIIKGFTVIRSK